jgi:hypothetical protein
MNRQAPGVAEKYHTENLRTALLILSNPHCQEETLAVRWARLVVANDVQENEWRLTA